MQRIRNITTNLLLLPLAAALVLACSGDDGPAADGTDGDDLLCTPGATDACTCDDGSMGEQVCLPSGQEQGPCVCDDGGTGTGTGTGTDTGDMGLLSLEGQWLDNWGGNHEIDQATWRHDTSTYHLDSWDNDAGWVIGQNDSANMFDPDRWSRFDWTDHMGAIWYCQTVYDGETIEDAQSATPADATDPENAGCGGFAWTRLDPSAGPEIIGTYDDDFGGVHTINGMMWNVDTGVVDTYIFEEYSNIDDWAVAQNSAGNQFNPDLYSRFDWTTDANMDLYYCQSVFDAPSADDAMGATAPDASDPANAGCGGFAWSKLTPQ